jgi:tetratricopeptide (TPR) repeat protein
MKSSRFGSLASSLSLSLALLLGGCALPAPDERQSFVPERELDVVSLAREGLAYYQKSRFVDAEFAFRRALYKYPGAPNLRANLAAALRETGQFAEAEDILLTLHESAKKSTEYVAALGQLYLRREDYASARKFYTLALELALKSQEFADASGFARSLAVVAFRIGDEAEALCQSALALLLREDAAEMRRHARLLLATNRVEKARATLTTYLNQAAGIRDPELMHQLAMAQFALGNYREAADLERAVVEIAGEERGLLLEARVLLYLSERRLGRTTQSAAEALEDVAEAQAAAQEEFAADLDAIPDRSALYWPAAVVEEVEGLSAQLEENS